MKNMNCMVCGQHAWTTTRCNEVEAAFCDEHTPPEKIRIPITVQH